MNYKQVQDVLQKKSNPERAKKSQNFFKTGPGEYGEGDRFLGIRVPEVRKVANQFKDLPLEETERLLHSEWHEARLCALIILSNKAENADPSQLKAIFELFKTNTAYINNWDLVDTSAPKIVGKYLWDKDRDILYKWATSNLLWERRIAIMSTFYFIRKEEYNETLSLAKQLLHDEHDLIHKAVGWMLREVGKRDQEVETQFLDQHVDQMPRTMLRYAIEKFPEQLRQHYLAI